MFKIILLVYTLAAFAEAQNWLSPLIIRPTPPAFQGFPPYQPQPQIPERELRRQQPYRLCAYNDVDFAKCLHTVQVAKNNSIPLNMECARKDQREDCINSVRIGTTDMVVLTENGYEAARSANLKPFVFAREKEESLFVAVVPRNITVVDLQKPSIFFDQSNPRAFYAGIYFLRQRGHDICGSLDVALGSSINIVDSATYVPNDEEMLICPNGFPAEFEDYRTCNFEVGLQRAVFLKNSPSYDPLEKTVKVLKIFQTILRHFNDQSATSSVENFNFFTAFQGQHNSILKDNTIDFDLQPTYRNGITEAVFHQLQCNDKQQPDDPKQLI